jgi:hypothetical protein
MTVAQKEAWFQLVVIAIVAIALLIAVPMMGWKALGCFGLLGLLGFSPLFYRRRAGRIVADERDASIRRRSAAVGFSVTWCVFIGACTSALLVYGDQGSVPVRLVEVVAWGTFALLYAVMSIATLVQYGWR